MQYIWSWIIACAIFICSIGIIPHAHADSADKTTVGDNRSGYNPAETYGGRYIPTRLFYRSENSPLWQRRINSDDYRSIVTCKEALAALETSGTWKGHLNADGTCSLKATEPAVFAIGNRINYDKSSGK